jgi:hypothetical protein
MAIDSAVFELVHGEGGDTDRHAEAMNLIVATSIVSAPKIPMLVSLVTNEFRSRGKQLSILLSYKAYT